MNTPKVNAHENALLSLLADELECSKKDTAEAAAAVGAKRRPNLRSASAGKLNDLQLGEGIVQHWFGDNGSEDVMLAGYCEGYQQAVEDMHTLIHAYYEGLN